MHVDIDDAEDGPGGVSVGVSGLGLRWTWGQGLRPECGFRRLGFKIQDLVANRFLKAFRVGSLCTALQSCYWVW